MFSLAGRLWGNFLASLGFKQCTRCGSWDTTSFTRQINDLTVITHEFHFVKYLECHRCGNQEIVGEDHKRY
jgi:translation initiation factor 2 beta subunit (eIF-2beta)/eIF-5